MSEPKIDVVGIGNAIVDVLAQVDDAFLERNGLVKGGMTLIDAQRALDLHGQMPRPVECSGGSAANTMVGLASLGSRSGYIGKLRDDEIGKTFRRDIRDAGVRFAAEPAHEGPPSGRCLVLVTPDAQRTMQTLLGASATLGVEDLDPSMIADAAVTYLEGYLFDPPPAKAAFLEAARLAHAAGRKVALSLSDSFCVDRHRAEFLELIDRHVDLLFANEDEIRSLFEVEQFDDAVKQLRGRCRTAALTCGAEGAVILEGDERVSVPAAPVDRVVDTTGAGDLYAAGFLHGWTRDRSPAECGRLGALAAGEIIGHVGARPETRLETLIGENGR